MLEFAPQILEQFQPRSPEAFFASFYDENATRGEFVRILSSFLPNGTFEIMCHPGYVDEAFAKESSYAFQRQNELEILTDPAMRKEVERRGIQLISFAQL
jgi:chitin disaccharide deacetylase